MLAPVERNDGSTPQRRRGQPRQRLLMRVAKLRCESGEYPCVMLDVSETGTSLRLFHEHPRDTHMYLELSNGEYYAVERRWMKDDTAGFMFSCKTEIEEFTRETHPKGRRPLRLRTALEVEFFAGGERSHAALVNFSAAGACIEAGRQVPVGSPIRIRLSEGHVRFAHVCWRREYRHGIVFQEELSLADFARLAAELQPFVAAEPVPEEERTSARA